jgi:hypothetical protein
MLTADFSDLPVREVMLGDGEVIGTGRLLGEHAHLVDEVGDELTSPDLEYLDGLSRGLQDGAVPHPVARRTVAVDQALASHFATNV